MFWKADSQEAGTAGAATTFAMLLLHNRSLLAQTACLRPQRTEWHARITTVKAMEPDRDHTGRHADQSTLTLEVTEVLTQLEDRGCFGYPGLRLDHNVVEKLAHIISEGAKEVLRQFETRVSEGQSYRTAGTLGEFIDKLLEVNQSYIRLNNKRSS